MSKNKVNLPILNAGTGTARNTSLEGLDGRSKKRRDGQPARAVTPGKPATPHKNAPGKVRIVGGAWKRTPVQVIDAAGLRPTPDRVRENLFNWLGPSIKGARCLDLFAGTGALGLEALSRGAAHVQFNETHLKAAAVIESLLDRLQRPPGATWVISRQDAVQCLANQAGAAQDSGGFDVVFLDPPFHQEWLARLMPGLSKILRPGARLYVESEIAVELPGMTLLKSGHAGQVHYHLFLSDTPNP